MNRRINQRGSRIRVGPRLRACVAKKMFPELRVIRIINVGMWRRHRAFGNRNTPVFVGVRVLPLRPASSLSRLRGRDPSACSEADGASRNGMRIVQALSVSNSMSNECPQMTCVSSELALTSLSECNRVRKIFLHAYWRMLRTSISFSDGPAPEPITGSLSAPLVHVTWKHNHDGADKSA